jgi:hypothetical protein
VSWEDRWPREQVSAALRANNLRIWRCYQESAEDDPNHVESPTGVDGGGLLMYQPNKTTRVDLLPAWYTVEYQYSDSSVSIIANHPVTCGLVRSDVPYPADRITDFSPEWVALVRGDQSGAASLLVTQLGAGRAAVDTGHNSRMALLPESDRFLERLGRWLMRSLP